MNDNKQYIHLEAETARNGSEAPMKVQTDHCDASAYPLENASKLKGMSKGMQHAQCLPGKQLHSQPSSSAYDTTLTAQTRLFSGSGSFVPTRGSPSKGGCDRGAGQRTGTSAGTMTNITKGHQMSSERDEYLMKLLSKGSKTKHPSQGMVSSSQHPSSSEFRIPEPVPPRGPSTVVYSIRHNATEGTTVDLNKDAPSEALVGSNQQVDNTPETDRMGQSEMPQAQDMEAFSAWSYADTEQYMGKNEASALRSAVVEHQVLFLEQLFDMHRAVAIQKVLVRACPEVNNVMLEANRILCSCSSHHDATCAKLGQTTKRARSEAERALHPDSQFAAVPLPGETVTDTGDGSGDDIDGSGGNGSGGGSTSPQPQAPPLPPSLAALQPAPSGSSHTPLAFQGRAGVPGPWINSPPAMNETQPMVFPTGIGYGCPQDFPAMYPMPSGADIAAGAMGGVCMDPMSWWYQNFHGSQQNRLNQNAMEVNPLNPMSFPPQNRTTQGYGVKWWHDPRQAFGPPADPDYIAQTGGNGGSGILASAVEVQSARRAQEGSNILANGRKARAETSSKTPRLNWNKSSALKETQAGGRPPIPASMQLSRQRRRKRKPEDPIDEASSGTTGPDHRHACTEDGINHDKHTIASGKSQGGLPCSPRIQEDKAAQLLLSMRLHGRAS